LGDRLMASKTTIIFVYNADSGPINGLKDYFHKIIKPETYRCNLCAVTFGNFGMENSWRKFINSLKNDVKFLHRDEFRKQFNLKDISFPATFIKKDEEINLLISRDEMNNVKTVPELINLVKNKIS
jgi:hypothetical protein